MTVSAAYNTRVAEGLITADPAQKAAANGMDAFVDRWQADGKGIRAVLGGLVGRKVTQAVRGFYMYGGVGRGKTMLMDMLVAELGTAAAQMAKPCRVRRVHFHAFMLEIHARLKRLREGDAPVGDFLEGVARGIADETDILCFDELHVNDIADAMILGPLFNNLMLAGVAVVATSNYAPDDLYRDGLQRARFLPFIKLLKDRMDICHLDSPTDYRLRALSEQGTWFSPLGDQSWGRMNALFETLTAHASTPPVRLAVSGRDLPILRADGHRAWLTFDTLCREARGAADYLALGGAYQAVFVDNVPRMSEENRNELRRFMTLVDTLYDLGRVLVVRAAAGPDTLYTGDSHSFEFQRTLSRILEMQSPEWLQAHSH